MKADEVSYICDPWHGREVKRCYETLDLVMDELRSESPGPS